MTRKREKRIKLRRKSFFKKLVTLASVVVLSLSLCSCGKGGDDAGAQQQVLDDNYRNWYEIFVYSYCDSDGDGIGDLKGVVSKLDYIREMGFTGIWLMPIMPSPTYHKYDVTDYYSIDSQYGTLEDFKLLIDEAHNRDIKVIIDLPVNHTSNEHEWFLSSKSSSSEYRDWYNWIDHAEFGYTQYGLSYYESRFVDTMPDLNLDNKYVREEIADIMEYWLDTMNCDGFRLDACTSYYTGEDDKSIEFLTWLGETARAVKPECYIVGEVWSPLEIILKFYESGIDSFFMFPAANYDGYITDSVIMSNPARAKEEFVSSLMLLEDSLEGKIQAPFISNHDIGRAAGFLRSDENMIKFGAGLLSVMSGSTFVYYGDEIAMRGSGDDPNKRIGMLWTTEEETTSPPPGTTKISYSFPSVADQQADEGSVLSYYKNAMNLRIDYPEISRGVLTVEEIDNEEVALLKREWNGSIIYIAINFSGESQLIATEKKQICGGMYLTSETAQIENLTLKIPSRAIVLLKDM